MAIKRNRRFHAEVHASSMSDIMFFLLLFFLIISTLANPNVIKMTLPKSKTNEKTNKQFISDSNIAHGDKYDYSKVNYINAHVKVTIICPEHGEFKQRPNNHLRGAGCSSCTKNGFNVQKQAILYYLKITTDTNQVLYKIGITNRTVNERFNLTDLSKIEIVKQKLYDNGQDALDWETRLKRMYKEYQYKGPDILSSGNTELFTEDIIAMWDSN